MWLIYRRKRPEIALLGEGRTVSFLERLHQANAELAKRDGDPLLDIVERTVSGMNDISTFALLDLIGLPMTTGNARLVSNTMRALGFVPIKSRRLMPGGYLNNVTRGWARPLRTADTSRLKPSGPNPQTIGGRNANE